MQEKIGRLEPKRYMLLMNMNRPRLAKSEVNIKNSSRTFDQTGVEKSDFAGLFEDKKLPMCRKSRADRTESTWAELRTKMLRSRCTKSDADGVSSVLAVLKSKGRRPS